MNDTVQVIPLLRLALMMAPVAVVLLVFQRWSAGWRTGAYAIGRMLVQLTLVGYILVFIFETDSGLIVISVLTVMLLAASWIALRPLQKERRSLYPLALASIGIGGVLTLVLVTQGVLDLATWHQGRFVIPLAGMIFAGSMNAVSLAAERFAAERERGQAYAEARFSAYRAALIPIMNSLFAVGVVSLPGMMTGQILAGIAPHLAVRYQIMVMAMIFGASGVSAACYLVFVESRGRGENPGKAGGQRSG